MKLNFTLPENDMSLAGTASTQLKKKLLQIGVPTSVVKKAVISLYEAEINMVIHGKGGDIDIHITPREIKAVLADNGPGIPDIDLAMQEGYSTATDDIREMGFGAGMGLPNIKKNSDFFYIESEPDKGTTVTIKVSIG